MKKLFILLALMMLTILAACGSDTDSNGSSGSNSGDDVSKLRVALDTQPPTLDPHMSSSMAMSNVTRTIFESLLTVNTENEIVPQLAESYDRSEDGKTYTFKLREGVLFHNGKEMKAEDVAASMNRWAELNSSVPEFVKNSEFVVVDDYTVDFVLEEPSAIAIQVLAKDKYYGAIIPKESIDEASETGITEYIGTGPYEFVEWKQDQYILQKKFEDYVSVDFEADGLSGKKEALIDEIYFEVVPDSSTQVAGIRSGEYDVVLGIPGEQYEMLQNDDSFNTFVSTKGHSALFFNKLDGVFTDVKMRQAVNAALDLESIMIGGYGNPDLIDLNSSYEQGFWYSEAGKEFYNEHDLDKAKKLVEESGYDGEPIKFVTTRDYEEYYNQAIIIQEQLEKVGIKVDIEVYDWPTRGEKLEDPANWDLSMTVATNKPTPIEHIYLNPDYVNGPEDEKTADLIHKMVVAETLEEAKATWDELQGYLWEYLTIVKIGDTMDLTAAKSSIKNFQYIGGPVLWNISLED